MLPFNEIAKTVLEAGKAVNDIGSLTQIRTEYPDLFKKPGNLEIQPTANAGNNPFERLRENETYNPYDSSEPYYDGIDSDDVGNLPDPYEGLENENIETPSEARSEYPSNFEKAETDNRPTTELKQYSAEINEAISSVKEAEIYSNAGLKEGIVNGRKALLRTDINMNQKDEFGQTNLERMKNGNPPIASNGEIIELHHIGQKADAPFAELTRTEHRGKGNDIILHDKNKVSEIDRNAFHKERQEHWQNRIGVEV